MPCCGPPGATAPLSRSTSAVATVSSGPSRLRTFHRRVSPPATCRSGPDFSEVDVNRAFLRGPDGKSIALPLTGLASCPCQVTSTELVPDGSLALGGYASWEPGMPPRTDIGQVVAWNTATRRVVATIRAPSPITAIAVTPDGESAVVVTADGWTLLDLGSFDLSGEWQALEPVDAFGVTEATARAESRAGRQSGGLPSGQPGRRRRSGDRRWNLVSRAIDDPDDLMLSAAWTPDSSSLLVGSLTGRVHVLDAVSLEDSAPTRLITGGFVIDVEISEDGAVAATMGTDGDVLLWDARSWKPFGLPVLDHGQWGYLHVRGRPAPRRPPGRHPGPTSRSSPTSGWTRPARPRTAT